MFESFVIDSLSFYESIIAPSFQQLVPTTGTFNGTLGEFTVMDNVASKRPIVSIMPVQNILQRRDASCDLIYKKVMNASTRSITTDELYAATQICKNEFYQGALKDWRNSDPLFGQRILPFFQGAYRTDLASNSYFGDITRIENPAAKWSTTKFDGIFKWIRTFYAAGLIPASQSVAMPIVDFRANPAQAYGIIKAMYDRQSDLLAGLPEGDKAFYVSKPLADGYADYLLSLGQGDVNLIDTYQNGVKVYGFKGIRIFVDPLWSPILTELYGANYNAAILTVRGNFVFATDKDYGEGENLDEALMIWYSREKLSHMYQAFMKAGTNIAMPEHIVFSLPNA